MATPPSNNTRSIHIPTPREIAFFNQKGPPISAPSLEGQRPGDKARQWYELISAAPESVVDKPINISSPAADPLSEANGPIDVASPTSALATSANVNDHTPNKDPGANQLLITAVETGNVDRAKRIIQEGRSYVLVETKKPDTRTDEKVNLLIIAALKGHAKMVQYLAHFFTFDRASRLEALQIALGKGDVETVKSLAPFMNDVKIYGSACWHSALEAGSDALVSAVLDNYVGNKGEVARIAMYAARVKKEQTEPAEAQRLDDRVKFLLDYVGKETLLDTLRDSPTSLFYIGAKSLEYLKAQYGDDFMNIIKQHRGDEGKTLIDMWFTESGQHSVTESLNWMIETSPELLAQSKIVTQPNFTRTSLYNPSEPEAVATSLFKNHSDPFAFIKQAWGNDDGIEKFVSLLYQGTRLEVLDETYKFYGEPVTKLRRLILDALQGEGLATFGSDHRHRDLLLKFLISNTCTSADRLAYLRKAKDTSVSLTERGAFGPGSSSLQEQVLKNVRSSLVRSDELESALEFLRMIPPSVANQYFRKCLLPLVSATALINQAEDLNKSEVRHDIDNLKEIIGYKDIRLKDFLDMGLKCNPDDNSAPKRTLLQVIEHFKKDGADPLRVTQASFDEVSAFVKSTFVSSTDDPRSQELCEHAHAMLGKMKVKEEKT